MGGIDQEPVSRRYHREGSSNKDPLRHFDHGSERLVYTPAILFKTSNLKHIRRCQNVPQAQPSPNPDETLDSIL